MLETLLVEAVVVVLMFIIWSEVDSEKRLIYMVESPPTQTEPLHHQTKYTVHQIIIYFWYPQYSTGTDVYCIYGIL